MRSILAIESSCDDTSAAVIEGREILSNVISSQNFHSKYKGIVPELASRAHVEIISKVCRQALEESGKSLSAIDAIAVTSAPGLIGSLIVGTNFAKGLAVRFGKPILPVNHIEGHIYSGCIEKGICEFPFVSLVVSGGHTAIFLVNSITEYEILGLTLDDAAGEAYDKTATLLGLPYPGGPHIDKLAQKGDPERFDFPRSMIHEKKPDFSFSGLKTSVKYFLAKNYPDSDFQKDLADICASLQAAITDVLVSKTINAAIASNVKSITVAGGVSANSELRRKMQENATKKNLKVDLPEMDYCVDNAAMIGFLAAMRLENSTPEKHDDLTFRVNPSALRASKKNRKIKKYQNRGQS